MADRVISAVCCFSFFLYLFLLINCNFGLKFEDKPKRLHISEDTEQTRLKKTFLIERNDFVNDDETSFTRTRRDASTSNDPKIVAKVSSS